MSTLTESSESNNHHIQRLLADLSIRASAHQRWPTLGFYDRAAQIVLSRISEPAESVAGDYRHERMDLLRSRWFDKLCQGFFTEHPEGMCIDLEAGLSTRFHRVCSTADWPRFCWVDVDTADVVALKSRLFPATENYYFLQGDTLTTDWLERSGWQPGTPLLVIMANPLTSLSERHLLHLLQYLADKTQCCQPLNVAFSYTRAGRLQRLRKYFLPPWSKQQDPSLVLITAQQLLEKISGYQLASDYVFENPGSSLHRPVHNACACVAI